MKRAEQLADVTPPNPEFVPGLGPQQYSNFDNFVDSTAAARNKEMVPAMNIPPFGMCMSLSNPTVAAATAAALGVLTPMPCVPVPVGPWKPGAAKTLIGNMPALTSPSLCNCSWGGVITITEPGQVSVQAT